MMVLLLFFSTAVYSHVRLLDSLIWNCARIFELEPIFLMFFDFDFDSLGFATLPVRIKLSIKHVR